MNVSFPLISWFVQKLRKAAAEITTEGPIHKPVLHKYFSEFAREMNKKIYVLDTEILRNWTFLLEIVSALNSC